METMSSTQTEGKVKVLAKQQRIGTVRIMLLFAKEGQQFSAMINKHFSLKALNNHMGIIITVLQGRSADALVNTHKHTHTHTLLSCCNRIGFLLPTPD